MPIILTVLLVLAFVFAWPAVVMLVWNAIALALGLPQLTYWVTWGILFLLGVVGRMFHTPRPKKD